VPSASFLKDGTQKCASDASAALEVVPTPMASLSDSTGEISDPRRIVYLAAVGEIYPS
jgi:hypothetical protein